MADRFMREVKRLHQLRQDINEMTPEEADELIRGLGDDAQALALSNGHISRHWQQRAFSGSVKQREGYRSRKGDFTSMPHSGHIHRWYSLRAGNAAERISCVSSRCVERHAGHRRRPHRAAQGRLHRVQARPAPQTLRRLPQPAEQDQCPARPRPRRWHGVRPETPVERGRQGTAIMKNLLLGAR